MKENDPRNILVTALKKGRLSHSYLFLGPETEEKKAFLLELSRLLLCQRAEEKGLYTPCGSCAHCIKSFSGTHPDLIVIEPEGSFIKIEQVRQLQEQIRFSPLEARRRICIIFNAKDMHVNAANALLKTLEEPPPGTHLFLSSPSTQALLPTIVSRCQVIRLGPKELFGQGAEIEGISSIIFFQDAHLKDALKETDIEDILDLTISFLISNERKIHFFGLHELITSSKEFFRAFLLILNILIRELYLLKGLIKKNALENDYGLLLVEKYGRGLMELAENLNCDTLRSFEKQLTECHLMMQRNVKIDMLADRLLIFWMKK